MRATTISLAAAAVLAAGCGAPRGAQEHEREVVILPAGDAARGKQAFGDLGCTSCHTVSGHDFLAPVATPPVNVELGSAWNRELTREELATAILNPSHEISRAYGRDATVEADSRSRMGMQSHAELRQLFDLVEFLSEVNRTALEE